jgi:hypothetical protein
MSKKTVSRIIGLFLSALLGICAISLPVFTFVILFVGGIVLGLIFSIQPVLLGMFSMAAMPVFSILEMIVDPNSHNLFPIEFIIYAVVSMVTVGGVFLGCRIRYKIFKNKA